jgi:hypothetical protein
VTCEGEGGKDFGWLGVAYRRRTSNRRRMKKGAFMPLFAFEASESKPMQEHLDDVPACIEKRRRG